MSPRANLGRLVRPHLDNLNRLFNATISDSRLDSQTYELNPDYHQIARRVGGEYSTIELSRGEIEFSQIITELSGTAHVTTAVYIYWLSEKDWVFRYEYSAVAEVNKPHSHLHVNGRHDSIPDLQKVHFPAGRMSVEHLIYHLVTEYAVDCRLDLSSLVAYLSESYGMWARTDRALFP